MWSDSLKIGVDKIDEQHEMLFSKVHQLLDELLDTGEYPKEKIISTILFLKDYAVTHFQDEEAYQLAIDDDNYLKHKKMHENFIATVLKEEEKMVASDFAYKDVSEFTGTLIAWLTYHVSGVDQQIGKAAETPAENESNADIICDCFRNVISSMLNINKDSIVKTEKHNETFKNSVTTKHSFTHVIKGYVVFDFSVSFISEFMYSLVGLRSDEIGDLGEPLLLQMSTTIIEKFYQRLNVDEYQLHESEMILTEKDETYPNERISFDTGVGLVEIGFAIA